METINCKDDGRYTEDSYRVYEFIKAHPELLTGIGSVLLIILSAVLSFCSYISERSIARYWDFDPVFIDNSSSVKLYGTVISFVLLCVLFLIFGVFVTIAISSKSLRHAKKCLRYFRNLNTWRKTITRLMPKYSKYNREAEEAIAQLARIIREKSKNRNRQMWMHFAVFEMLLMPVMLIWGNSGSVSFFSSWNTSIFSAITASTGMIFLMFVLANFSIRDQRIARREVRTKYDQAEISAEIPDIVLPLMQLSNNRHNIDFRMSDYEIKELLWKGVILVLVVIIGLTLVCSVLGYNAAMS